MAEESYGESQIREIRYSQAELIRLAIQHFQSQHDTPYDFDYERPIVIQDKDGVVLRYFQTAITQTREGRDLPYKSIAELMASKSKK